MPDQLFSDNIPIVEYDPTQSHHAASSSSTVLPRSNDLNPYRGITTSASDNANVNANDDPEQQQKYRKSYANLSNIDWTYEYELDLNTLHKIQNSTIVPIWQKIIHTNSISISLFLIGFVIGPVAILIDVCSRYLNDIRYGVCKTSLLSSRVQCSGAGGEGNWETWSQLLFNVKQSSSWFAYANNYFIFIALSVIFAYITTLLVNLQPLSKYSGISEIKMIISGFILNHFLNWSILVTKSVGLIFVIGSGIWVGKEGALVHIATCIASMFCAIFPRIQQNEAVKREIITAAAAAGISVAFNAPVGGVLFCLEQIKMPYFPVDRLMWNSFVCATIAVMMLQLVHPFNDLIHAQIFQVTNDSQNWLKYEIIPFMFLGILCGYLGVLFNKLNVKFAQVRHVLINRSIKFKILDVVFLGLITAIISQPFVITRIQLTELISVLFSDCTNSSTSSSTSATTTTATNVVLDSLCYETDHFPWKVIFLLLIASIQGFALAAYSYGTYIPGGLLMPSLTIGALIGRLMGTFVEFLQFEFPNWYVFKSCSTNPANCITSGSYAVVGAASFLSSVTKMSVSVVIILFELTGALNYVIPIMIGVLLSRFVSDLYMEKSCYDLWLQLQKYPYLRPGLTEDTKKPILAVVTCQQFIRPTSEIVCIYDDELSDGSDGISILENFVKDYKFEGFPVLNNRRENHLIGWCSRHELAIQLAKFQDFDGAKISFQSDQILNKILFKTDYFIVSTQLSILTLYSMFDKLSMKLAIFTKPDRNIVFKSLLTKKDLIEIVETNDSELFELYNQRANTNVEFSIDQHQHQQHNNNNVNEANFEEFVIEDEVYEDDPMKNYR